MNNTIKYDLETYIGLSMKALGGIVIIDKAGMILYMNERYVESMNIDDPSGAIGKPITEIVPDTHMMEVIQSGKPHIGVLYKRGDNEIIVNRWPLFKNNEIIGAIGHSTFAPIYQVNELKSIISKLNRDLDYFKSELKNLYGAKYTLDQIVTNDRKMLELKDFVVKIARTKSTVLITGESGTGKELFAHSIHHLSDRRTRPLIRLNCAAIPETLIESELYGYESGSFTGASSKGHKGVFENANGGTLLLDEIDALPYTMQSKLLRTLQEKEVQKIGRSTPVEVDIRFIFTSNKNLSDMVAEEKFREDLFYRINVVNIHVPPLRERVGDIPELIQYFIVKLNKELGLNITSISEEAVEFLASYSYPGNIRELENAIERAFNYAISGQLEIEHFAHFSQRIAKSKGLPGDDMSLHDLVGRVEKDAIIRALKLSNGSKSKAAELLQIDRSVLYEKIKKHGISVQGH